MKRLFMFMAMMIFAVFTPLASATLTDSLPNTSYETAYISADTGDPGALAASVAEIDQFNIYANASYWSGRISGTGAIIWPVYPVPPAAAVLIECSRGALIRTG
ncbi:MAG TPA: hypothetical protein ENJ35_04290 [Gammaproteobacteria bacterium]|nr:hypothetical protein [Gammaproteobacteria bacterium]